MSKRKKQTQGPYINETKRTIESFIGNSLQFFKFRNQHQQEFCELIDKKEIILCSGPAGTGKSVLSIVKSLELLKDPHNEFYKIIICTPAVQADEDLGYLKGSLSEKLEPYIYSTTYLFKKILGEEAFKNMIDHNFIEIIGLGFIRGVNIDNSLLIAEEFQNATPRQVKTLLTRIGHHSKFIISGDIEQSDRYKKESDSGLCDALKKFSDMEEIGVFKFDQTDIVRNKIISKILDKYKS